MFKRFFKRNKEVYSTALIDTTKKDEIIFWEDPYIPDKTYLDEEEKLYQTYGECYGFNKKIKILAFADTHNIIASINYDELKKKSQEDFDVCLLLGDITVNDMRVLLTLIPKEKIFGLLGNHDDFDNLARANIKHVNMEIFKIKDVRIAVLQGSYKYKESDFPSYTQEESIEALEILGESDILISHDGPFLLNGENTAHQGLFGITQYLYKNHVPINIHGHIHQNNNITMPNGTQSISVYGCRMITLDNNTIKIE